MTEQEKQALEQLKSTAKEAVEGAMKQHKDEVEFIKSKLNDIEKNKDNFSQDEFKKHSDEIIRIASELKALKENSGSSDHLNVNEFNHVEKALIKNKENLNMVKDGTSKGMHLEMKAVATIATNTHVTAVGTGGLSYLLNSYEAGTLAIPRTEPFFLSTLSAVPTTGNTISWAQIVDPEGSADMVAEGALKPQIDFQYSEATTSVKKVAAWIKVTKEGLDDIAGIANDINNELRYKVLAKANSNALSGDGTGNNLLGALSVATAFNATTAGVNLLIVTPNRFDVLQAALNQIAIAEVETGIPAGFMGNKIYLHPTDALLMRLTKDKNENYVFPYWFNGGQNIIDVPVVVDSRITLGSFFVADTTKINLRVRESFGLDIGYVNDDFTKNLVTILGEMRLAIFVKAHHVKALVKGTFAAAITAMTKP